MDVTGSSGSFLIGPAQTAPEAGVSSAQAPGSSDPTVPSDRVSIHGSAKKAPELKLPGSQRSLSPEEMRIVAELQARDREVRDHEAAHTTAGGSLSGAPSYTYESGPDGKTYAIAGEVAIDLSHGHTPEETIIRARRIRAAALAPVDPSGQDMSVASAASEMEAEAHREKAALQKLGDPSSTGAVQNRAGATLRWRPGGGAHLHSSDGCGSCAQGVAYYRALARSG